MKYLKGTLVLFVATFLFAVISVDAATSYKLTDITIPVLGGSYVSSQREKYDVDFMQTIRKEKCTDDWSGDGRVIMAHLQGMYAGNHNTSLVEAKPNVNVALGPNSESIGAWKLWLHSNKSLPSTASFWGTWSYDA